MNVRVEVYPVGSVAVDNEAIFQMVQAGRNVPSNSPSAGAGFSGCSTPRGKVSNVIRIGFSVSGPKGSPVSPEGAGRQVANHGYRMRDRIRIICPTEPKVAAQVARGACVGLQGSKHEVVIVHVPSEHVQEVRQSLLDLS